MHAASRPAPNPERPPSARDSLSLTRVPICTVRLQDSSPRSTRTRRSTSWSTSTTRHLHAHGHAAKRLTSACRSCSCGRRARVLPARARQCGAHSPCPRAPPQPQLASLPPCLPFWLGSPSLACTSLYGGLLPGAPTLVPTRSSRTHGGESCLAIRPTAAARVPEQLMRIRVRGETPCFVWREACLSGIHRGRHVGPRLKLITLTLY